MTMVQDVERGMNLLDERMKPGWDRRINLETLDINDSSECMLGQLFGDFGTGLMLLGISGAEDYGFLWHNGSYEAEIKEADALTEVWKQKISERRGQQYVSPDAQPVESRPLFFSEFLLLDEATLV